MTSKSPNGWSKEKRFIRMICVYLFQRLDILLNGDEQLNESFLKNVDDDVIARYEAIQPIFMSLKRRDNDKGKITDNSVTEYLQAQRTKERHYGEPFLHLFTEN